MIRKIAIALILLAVLFSIQPIIFARTVEKKDETDPVTLLKKEQLEARKKQLEAIADLMERIRALEAEIERLNGKINKIKGAEEMARSILDELHDLVKQKEEVQKEHEAEKKDLDGKEKKLKDEDVKREEEVESLKANLIKDDRKQLVSKLKKDLRKYEKIIASPSVEKMSIKKSAWRALAIKYPEQAKGVKVGDTEELKFRVNYGGMTNSMGMKFVLVQAGKFQMGSPDEEKFRMKNETRYKVIIREPFYLQTTEVTQRQWIKIMGENPSEFKKGGRGCPVETVSWDECQEFIKKINEHEGTDKYRLPTEAEWEYACRAGRSSAFANGDISASGCGLDPILAKMGWYCANAWRTTHPVAKKEMNRWGLFDMHGNVWEWCSDWYGQYPEGAATDPKGSRFGPKRVIRGGSFRNNSENCRSAYRFAYETNLRMNNVGLRLAMTP